jgi:hypothetical protein
MANMSKNIDLFTEEPNDGWKKKYWKGNASVETVLKPRNLEEESKDFFQAQLDMTKDGLPKQTMAEKGTTVDSDHVRLDLFDQQWHRNEDFAKAKTANKMTVTPQEAYNIIYPHGNPVAVSPNTKPTSSLADDHKGGYRGDEGVPQGRIGSIQLEEKSGASVPIGDHYLPDTAWNGKDKVKPPITQQSSSSEAENRCNAKENPVSVNVGSLIEQALNKTNKNMNPIDMSAAIASTKEKKVLNKPFKTPNGKAAYAVYVKNDKDSIVRVDFNACQASDPTSLGPVWTSEHWGAQVNVAKAEDNTNHATKSLDQLSDFYYEKPVNPKNTENWDGYSFYSHEAILASMPSLKLMPAVYTQNIVTNKGAATPADTEYNSAVKKQLDVAAAK